MAKNIDIDGLVFEFESKKRSFDVHLSRSGKPEPYARERKGRGGFYNPKGGIMLSQRKELYASLTDEAKLILNNILTSGNDYYVTMNLKYFIPIPESDSNKTKILKEKGCILPTCRNGDIDNLDKFYLDACHNILYDDDKRVVKIVAEEFYSTEPRVEIHAVYTIIEK